MERVEYARGICGRSYDDEGLPERCDGEYPGGDFEADRGGGKSFGVGASRDGLHAVSRYRV